jgi:hypothetical protein
LPPNDKIRLDPGVTLNLDTVIDRPNLTAIIAMAPKGGNAKKESGRSKKAENEANRRAAAAEAKVRTISQEPCSLSRSIEAYA